MRPRCFGPSVSRTLIAIVVAVSGSAVMTVFAQVVPPPATVTQVPAPAVPGAVAPDPRLEEARREYDATNYEIARDLLDAVIARIAETGANDPSQRAMLAAAYELRGRARMNLRDLEGARADFRALLLVEPTYVLPPLAGPRAEALFDEVRRVTVGQVDVAILPADAEVMLDGVRLAERPPTLTLVAGTHTVSASRRGHRTASQTFTIVPGAPPQAISLVLEREFSTLMLSTSPAGVEVVVDDVPRGRTEAEPAGSLGGEGARSRTLVIEGLASGRHRLEFRRECFITAERTLDFARPDDVVLEPVRLEPAVATVSVSANATATVFVDEVARGAAPQSVGDLCRGRHTIEVRSATGRDLRRIDVSPGQKISFEAAVRPAFALVSESGPAEGQEAQSLRLAAEAAFQPTRSITLFATPAARTAEALAIGKLPADWLAFDALRRPLGGAASVNDSARRDLGARLIKTFEAQGVAAVTRDPAGDGKTDMLLSLLAPGSARPDVIRWKVDAPATIAQAVARLDDVPPLTKPSVGMLAVDVLDVPGVVVASVEPAASAATAGLQPGDAVLQVDGKAVTSAAQLRGLVDAAPPGQALTLDVRGRDGVERKASLAVQRVPRLIEPQDRTVLSNSLAVAYTHMAAAAGSPLDEVAIRLNLATAWMRLENWSAAVRELDKVVAAAGGATLTPAVRDAVAGTAQYLQAQCAEASGDLAGAERWLGLAATSRSAMLTDGGEPISALSERRLAQIRKGRGAN